jgi:hypothetical protein
MPVQRCSSYFELLTGAHYNQTNVESNFCLAPSLSPSPDESANNSSFIRQLTETSDEGNSNSTMFTKSMDLSGSSSNSQPTDYETNKEVAAGNSLQMHIFIVWFIDHVYIPRYTR